MLVLLLMVVLVLVVLTLRLLLLLLLTSIRLSSDDDNDNDGGEYRDPEAKRLLGEVAKVLYGSPALAALPPVLPRPVCLFAWLPLTLSSSGDGRHPHARERAEPRRRGGAAGRRSHPAAADPRAGHVAGRQR